MNVLVAIFLCFFHIPLSDRSVDHDFHVSKLDVRYNPSSKSCELTLHLFLDDLEAAMKASGMVVESLKTSDEDERSNTKISQYLTSKIRITADGKLLNLQYIGREEAERFDAVFIYLEADQAGVPGQLNVENKLFHEIFTDQKNIVSVTFDKKLKAFEVLDKKQSALHVTF